MSTEETKTEAITQPSPFNESAWNTSPPTKQEPIVEEKPETPTAETKDPVIEEKDKKIEDEGRENTKPEQPETVPAATPKDIPARPEKDKVDITPATELKFENEESRKLFEAIKAGKNEDVLNILSQQQTFAKLDTLKPEEIIKLNLKYSHKDYTDTEIQDLFEEKYSLPQKPEQDITESDDDFALREEKYKENLAKAERRIEREAKNAKTELSKFKQELVLPDIPQEDPKSAEPTQEDLDRLKKQGEQFLQAVDGSLNELNDYSATFKDKEVEIPVAYKIDKEEKEALKPLLNSLNTDLPQFFQQLEWLDKDGQPNLKKVVSDLHILKNKEAVIQKLVNEAGNKRYAQAIKSQKNVDFTGKERKGSLEPDVKEEVDRKVRSFLAAT